MAPTKSRKVSFWQWLGTIVSLLLLVYVLLQQDWRVWQQLLTHLLGWKFLLAWGAYVLGMTLNGVRWYWVAHAVALPLSLGDAIRWTFVAAFVSNVFPSTFGGDMVRIAILARRSNRWGLAIASTMIDRLLKMSVMLSASPLTLATFGSWLKIRHVLVGGIWERFLSRERWIAFWEQSANWRRRPLWMLSAFLLAWVSVIPYFFATWLLARALGIPVTFAEVIGAMVISYFVTLLPISINGLGMTIIRLYTFLGATPEQASMLALSTRFLMFAVSLLGWFMAPRYWRELLTQDEQPIS